MRIACGEGRGTLLLGRSSPVIGALLDTVPGDVAKDPASQKPWAEDRPGRTAPIARRRGFPGFTRASTRKAGVHG
jgi:hypothetical protein